MDRKKSEVQSIIFERWIYDTKKARKWLDNNKFKTIGKAKSSPTQLTYTIKHPQGFKRFRSSPSSKGITLVIGFKTKKPAAKPKKPVPKIKDPAPDNKVKVVPPPKPVEAVA